MLLYGSILWSLAHQTVTQQEVYFPLQWYNFHLTWSWVCRWTIAFLVFLPGEGFCWADIQVVCLTFTQLAHMHTWELLSVKTAIFCWLREALLQQLWLEWVGKTSFSRAPECFFYCGGVSFKFFSPCFSRLTVVLQEFFLYSELLWKHQLCD